MQVRTCRGYLIGRGWIAATMQQISFVGSGASIVAGVRGTNGHVTEGGNFEQRRTGFQYLPFKLSNGFVMMMYMIMALSV
jgi:hypothetical protein